MKNRNKRFYTEGVLVLLLFVLFAVCLLAVLLTGADAYRRLTEKGQEAFLKRTVPQYIATKVRQADAAGTVAVTDFSGVEALELRETVDGKMYVTRIYSYEGYIRELFSESTVELCPSDGEKIAEAGQITFFLAEGCLRIVITEENGEEIELKLMLRSSEEAVK